MKLIIHGIKSLAKLILLLGLFPLLVIFATNVWIKNGTCTSDNSHVPTINSNRNSS